MHEALNIDKHKNLLHSLSVNREVNFLSLVSPWLDNICQIKMKLLQCKKNPKFWELNKALDASQFFWFATHNTRPLSKFTQLNFKSLQPKFYKPLFRSILPKSAYFSKSFGCLAVSLGSDMIAHIDQFIIALIIVLPPPTKENIILGFRRVKRSELCLNLYK